jgi:predicted O-methyltransferase YrrM
MGGRGGLEGLYNIIKSFGYTSILETGVAYGWSSLAILLAIKESNAKLISIDMPYVNMNNESFVGVVVHPDLHKQWTLIRKPDRNGIPEALNLYNGKFDLIHYDSDKSYVGRQWAYPILWDALKIGGIFISDDIQDNVGFKEFCEHRNLNPLIYESDNKYVGVVQKVGV